MRARRDGGLAALRVLLRTTHLAGPDDLPALVQAAGAELGAVRAVLYLVDYDQVLLMPVVDRVPGGDLPQPVSIEGTLAGRSFSDVSQHATASEAGPALWTPVLDGTDRLGVLHLQFDAGSDLDEELMRICADVAALIADVVSTRALYGDAVERTRRSVPMTLPAELQWRLLPPLTFVSPRVAVSGILAPTHEVAGDSFDYALNGQVLHVALVDAMGHGLESTLLASVAVGALRNARRAGLTLPETVQAMDAVLSAQFGPDRFVTGIVGELDVDTGWWRWATCGHPPALLVRGGRVVKELDAVISVPLGMGMHQDGVEVGAERLQRGDRLLLFTDGVVEARNADGVFFGTERLAELVIRQDAAQRPAAETLRRLNHAILAHQDGALQDDATTVLVEWMSQQPDRSTPPGSEPPPH
jgi:serine phosphatase RsbU (regulator of sigma subunit)